ncbi:RNA polymerase sigma factor [Cerasicoccus fimbriatus]|uniref:RNA polymerase sigma factor n=1 Tax=Cerasicoccus fimbriatus TaxID=3014554 RepID=UPI0022B2BC6F|nr:sigma-70 family RNA polymerase sigma factor [Cerasicoccus sp. TK19100]
MESEPKDEELIAKIGHGNENALVHLMVRHKQAVFQFIYRYLCNPNDAAEITEETFLKVYQNAARFKVKATPKTWIFAIALNLSRDRIRKEKKRKGHLSLHAASEEGHAGWSLEERLQSSTPAPLQSIESSEELIRIQNEIAQLPEKLKFPFIYCILEEHSYDECAAIIKTSRKTVETRIYRARQILKSQLE